MADKVDYRKLADAIWDDLKRTGQYDELMQELAKRPGSRLRVRPTPSGGLEFTVEGGPRVWRLLASLAVMVLLLGTAGFGLAILYRALFGGAQDLELYWSYRGGLLGALICVMLWHTEGYWHKLSGSQRGWTAALAGLAVGAILAFGIALGDLWGTVLVGVALGVYLLMESR